MTHRFILATLWTLVFMLAGCGEKGVGTFPPTEGDFVKNSGDRGTAQIWGIQFDVANPVGGSAESHFEGTIHSDRNQTDARITIALGDDVNVRLEKVPGSAITFHLNGQLFGNVSPGETVAIDRDRDVTVNGTPRQAAVAAP